jgi:tight adherence protein B
VLRGRADRVAAHARTALIPWCVALASELQVGRTPVDALHAAALEADPAIAAAIEPIGAVGSLGGDVAAAFNLAATRPGLDALRHVAVCWSVAGETGAGLATSLRQLGAAWQSTQRLRDEVIAQLASARASARVLAVLPIFGVLLGEAVGATPVQFLLHTAVGAGCLTATVALDVAGLAWTDRIAARVPSP